MLIRLGDLLVGRGVITAEQRDQLLEHQRTSGRPLGVLAEEMLGVSPRVIEDCWAQQYAAAAEWIDPLTHAVKPAVLTLVDPRQAWQFRFLPLSMQQGELHAATSRQHLPRALRFAGWRLRVPVCMVLCEPMTLGEALARHFPMPGMSPEDVLPAPAGSAASHAMPSKKQGPDSHCAAAGGAATTPARRSPG